MIRILAKRQAVWNRKGINRLLSTDHKNTVIINEGQVSVEMNKKFASYHTTENIIKRDISIQVLTLFSETLLQERIHNQENELHISNEIKMLDVNASSGLRSLRYLKEIPLLSSITMNNHNIKNSEYFNDNLERNNISKEKVNLLNMDPRTAMYSHIDISKQFDIIEIDSSKSVSTYLDAAVQAINNGGMLCITNTDSNVLKGSYPEICYSRYGSVPLSELYTDEQSLRILLYSIEIAANRYGKYIHPWLSISNVNTQRLYIRIYHSPAKVRKCLMNQVRVYQSSRCPSFIVQAIGKYKKGTTGLVYNNDYTDTTASTNINSDNSVNNSNSHSSNDNSNRYSNTTGSSSDSMPVDSIVAELMTTFGANNNTISSSNSNSFSSNSNSSNTISSLNSNTDIQNIAEVNTVQTIEELPSLSYLSIPLDLEPSGDTMFSTTTYDPLQASYCLESGGKWKIGGPYYGGSLYDTTIINSLLFKFKNIKYQLNNTKKQTQNKQNTTTTTAATDDKNTMNKHINIIISLLTNINMELNNIVFYYDIKKLAQTIQGSKVPKVLEIQSGLVNAGYKASGFQNNGYAIKTDAPHTVVWDIMRSYCQRTGQRHSKFTHLTPTAERIMAKATSFEANFALPKVTYMTDFTDN